MSEIARYKDLSPNAAFGRLPAIIKFLTDEEWNKFKEKYKKYLSGSKWQYDEKYKVFTRSVPRKN